MNAPDTSSNIGGGDDFKSMLLSMTSNGGKVSIVVALGHGYYDSVCGGSESIDCMYAFVKTWDRVVPRSMEGVVVSGVESTTSAVTSSSSTTTTTMKGSYSLGVTLPLGTLSSYQKYTFDYYYLLLMDFWCPSIASYAASNPNNVFNTYRTNLGSFMVTSDACSGGRDSPIPQKDIISINNKTGILWSTRHSGSSSCPYPLSDGTCTQNDRAELGTLESSIHVINLIDYMKSLFTTSRHGFYYMSLMPDSWFY